MIAHPDILDQPEPLGKWIVASIVLHIAVTGALIGHNLVRNSSHFRIGDPHGGGFGAVAVNTVSTIPLPSRSGPVNPVANDTESRVPTPPPKTKAQPKVKPPEPDAIAIGKLAKKRPSPIESAPPNKFREQQKFSENQLYSNVGQAANTPMYSRPGGGGVGLGNNSPFGTAFGAYASMLQQTVARNWKTSDVDPRISSAPAVSVVFTIQRDGSLAPGSLRILQRSGILPLDYSAQRAVLDSAPFPPLPAGFPRNSADVEMRFELRR